MISREGGKGCKDVSLDGAMRVDGEVKSCDEMEREEVESSDEMG